MNETKEGYWQDWVSLASVIVGAIIIMLLVSTKPNSSSPSNKTRSPSNQTATQNSQPQKTIVKPSSSRNTRSSSSQTTARNSDPTKTITRYYQLATTNRKSAIQLLSDDWRQREANKINSNKDSWWNSVKKAQVYNSYTFVKGNREAKIKIWLKYSMRDGRTSCESLIFNLVFDRDRNQWLIDNVEPNSRVMHPRCGRQ